MDHIVRMVALCYHTFYSSANVPANVKVELELQVSDSHFLVHTVDLARSASVIYYSQLIGAFRICKH